MTTVVSVAQAAWNAYDNLKAEATFWASWNDAYQRWEPLTDDPGGRGRAYAERLNALLAELDAAVEAAMNDEDGWTVGEMRR